MDYVTGMKWIAYAKAHVEGEDYYFSYDFNIPEDLYLCLIDDIYFQVPIKDNERYEELMKYAQIAINYRKLCWEDEDLEAKEKDENYDDYWSYLSEYNSDRKRVNATLEYLRIFDPNEEKLFVEYCLDNLGKSEYFGKKVTFYYQLGLEEEFSWEMFFDNDNVYFTKDITPSHIDDANAVYPPFSDIMDALKNGEITATIT